MSRISRRVIDVHDGDTFSVSSQIWYNGKPWNRVRIANFNAPELNAVGGLRAKKTLARIIHRKMVTLSIKGTSWDRLVCDVFIGNANIVSLL